MNNLTETERTALQMKKDYGIDLACKVAARNINFYAFNGVEKERYTKIYSHLIIMRNKTFHS
jgi:hypothetical protein